MPNPTDTKLTGDQSVTQTAKEIAEKARALQSESKRLRLSHQTFTILTILLGVSAPAIVTYTPNPQFPLWWWHIFAIGITAFATASATIRTVLRFGERYSSAALTAITLLDIEAQVHAKQQEVLMTVKEEFQAQKLFEVAGWARKQMFEAVKAYIEKDVSALTQEKIQLVEPPKIEASERIDPTRKLNAPVA